MRKGISRARRGLSALTTFSPSCTRFWTESSDFASATARMTSSADVVAAGRTCFRVPPAGLEPAHPAPEAGALSAELRGRIGERASLATALVLLCGDQAVC